jgi:hypothetical protein
MPSDKAYRKSSKASKNMKAMTGGSCVSAHASIEQIAPMAAQQEQMNSQFSTTANGGHNSTTLAPFQSKIGGAKKGKNAKKIGGAKKGTRESKKFGGYGFEMLVPAVLLAANQLYKPKGKTVSFRKSRKNRTMRLR